MLHFVKIIPTWTSRSTQRTFVLHKPCPRTDLDTCGEAQGPATVWRAAAPASRWRWRPTSPPTISRGRKHPTCSESDGKWHIKKQTDIISLCGVFWNAIIFYGAFIRSTSISNRKKTIKKKGLVYIFTIILYFKNMDRLVAGWNIKDSFKYLMVFCRVF